MKRNKLSADLRVFAPPAGLPSIAPDKIDEITMAGGFFDGSYLQFSYQNKEPRRKQMGVIVLRLNGNGDGMSGHYAGFSPYREKLVVGEVEFYRPGQRPEKTIDKTTSTS